MNRPSILAISIISSLGVFGLASCDQKKPKTDAKTKEVAVETEAKELTEEDYLEAMKASINNGEFADITWEEVVSYKMIGEEERKGKTYMTATIVYEEASAMGAQRLNAKAWMKGEQVRWEHLDDEEI